MSSDRGTEIEREALRRLETDAAGDQEHLAAESTYTGAFDLSSKRGQFGTRVFNIRSNRGTVRGTRDAVWAGAVEITMLGPLIAARQFRHTDLLLANVRSVR